VKLGQSDIQTPVLIVGGGPVGMALGLLLDRFGIDHVIVEREPTTTKHPKARGITGRTMEMLRLWGIEDRVRAGGLRAEVGAEAASLAWAQVYCESGVGRMIGATNPEPTVNSPSPKCCVAQNVVEEALDDVVKAARHTTFLRETELVDFENGADGVKATVRDLRTGAPRTVRARFMAACDGSDSRVREMTGVEVVGAGYLHNMASYYYRADLAYLPHAGRYLSLWIIPQDRGVPFGPILATGPSADRWLFVHYMTEGEAPLTEEALISVVRAHWGVPDLEVELIDMMRWRMQAVLASTFRERSVFLVGDAAHAIPPTGGLGLNTGVQDAHNLAWKLALVLRGQAEDAVLDTYSTERQPYAGAVIQWAIENRERQLRASAAAARRHEDPAEWRAALRDVDRSLQSEGLAMGWIYPEGALVPDGAEPGELDPGLYRPTDQTGARFPHMWLDAGRRRSTIDWFDTDFVLVTGSDAQEWRRVGERVAGEGTMPLAVRSLPWMAGHITFESDEAVLVRPDGHVAWRSGPVPDAEKHRALSGAMSSILRPAAAHSAHLGAETGR
jgi:2-polyprenyl-6-methoxyphenol hydroxylase-like FAD-dependent oxidoreductase